MIDPPLDVDQADAGNILCLEFHGIPLASVQYIRGDVVCRNAPYQARERMGVLRNSLTLRSIAPFYHTLDLVLCTNASCSSVRTLRCGDGSMQGGGCRMGADRRSACVYPLA